MASEVDAFGPVAPQGRIAQALTFLFFFPEMVDEIEKAGLPSGQHVITLLLSSLSICAISLVVRLSVCLTDFHLVTWEVQNGYLTKLQWSPNV